VVASVILIAALCVVQSEGTDTLDLVQTEETLPGTIGCTWWRMRSITNAVGEYWQIKEIQFFESADGSGNAVSADHVEQTVSSTYKDSPAPGQPDTSEYRAEKAMDGDDTTYWSSSSDVKFEYFAVQFKTPKDIRSVKCQLEAENMGPMMVIIEKSFDGENWARSTEVSDMLDWDKKMETYPLVSMDVLPTVSTFSLRSQANPKFCVGVKETPAEDPEDPPLPLEEGAILEMQPCADAKSTQYWQLRSDFLLGNAKDVDVVIHVAALQDQGVLDVKKYACEQNDDGSETCPAWAANSMFQFAEEAKGGLMHSKSDNNANLVIRAENIDEGEEVKLGACGADGTTPADVANCASDSNGRFEAKPMFLVEPRKMAVACAPYTHMNIEPDPAENEVAAMTLCAKKSDCLAYNWANNEAVCEDDPPCEGKYTLHSWSCEALHEVHGGMDGWSLGVRAGKLEPFVEERVKAADL